MPVRFKGGGGGGTTSVDPFTDAFSLRVVAPDSNAAPTEAAAFAIALAKGDSNAALTETATLKFPAGVYGDSNTTPTETNAALIRVWLSATTMNSTNGVTNPSNANSANNATNAVYTSVLTGDANPRTTSTLGANVPTVSSFTTAIYRGWFSGNTPLGTSTISIIANSSSALFADITMYTLSASGASINHLSGSFTFDFVAAGVDTVAKLQSLRIYHRTLDAAAGVSPAVLNVDAGALDLNGAF